MTALDEIKKTNHPDRIWATVNGMSTRLPDGARQLVGGWSQDAARAGSAEYVLASTLEILQRENEELRRDLSHEASHRQKLQNALAYWMPGVTEETEISTNGRCGDDAWLLVGSEGPFEDKCWGNEAIARAEAAEAEVKRLKDIIKKNWRGSAWRAVTHDMANEVRTALASTGGEHHAE